MMIPVKTLVADYGFDYTDFVAFHSGIHNAYIWEEKGQLVTNTYYADLAVETYQHHLETSNVQRRTSKRS